MTATYVKMLKDAARRRKALEKEVERARGVIAGCESEMAILDQVVAALGEVDGAPAKAVGGRGRKKGKWRPGGPGRPPKGAKRPVKKARRGKWRPGRPGRPPRWYVERQKDAAGKSASSGKAKKNKGRAPAAPARKRAKRGGRRKAK